MSIIDSMGSIILGLLLVRQHRTQPRDTVSEAVRAPLVQIVPLCPQILHNRRSICSKGHILDSGWKPSRSCTVCRMLYLCGGMPFFHITHRTRPHVNHTKDGYISRRDCLHLFPINGPCAEASNRCDVGPTRLSRLLDDIHGMGCDAAIPACPHYRLLEVAVFTEGRGSRYT